MIYSKDDVIRILNEIPKRLKENNPDFAADEMDDILDVIEKLKEKL